MFNAAADCVWLKRMHLKSLWCVCVCVCECLSLTGVDPDTALGAGHQSAGPVQGDVGVGQLALGLALVALAGVGVEAHLGDDGLGTLSPFPPGPRGKSQILSVGLQLRTERRSLWKHTWTGIRQNNICIICFKDYVLIVRSYEMLI